jgi:TetR/AcrR family transcriptional repressor of nem operon
MTSTTDTKTAILDAAQDLVQKQSISGVSFQQLANHVGIKKGSMYHHFASKDELMVGLLDRVHTQLKETFDRGEGKPALKRLKYYLEIYRSYILPGQNMCPAGAFAGEWGSVSQDVQKAVQRILKMQIKNIADIVRAGMESGDFVEQDRSPDQIAKWIFSMLQGSLVCDRVMETKSNFALSAEMITEYLTGKN